MITGFNTDVEHDGVVYHVQTEDKGLDSPIILSLVYSGGAILASKRSPYKDLIEEGFSDEALAERLKRQHRLICAAIHSGRLDDLKKMSSRGSESAEIETKPEIEPETTIETSEPAIAEVSLAEEVAPTEEVFEWKAESFDPSLIELPPEPYVEREPVHVHEPVLQEQDKGQDEQLEEDATAPYTVYDAGRQAPVTEIEEPQEGLIVSLLDDEDFYSGDQRLLRVLVTERTPKVDKPLANVSISVKILGTTFRPLLYSLKTERDGVATVSTQIPEFTSGRAAVLIRAVTKKSAAELRRVIHPGK